MSANAIAELANILEKRCGFVVFASPRDGWLTPGVDSVLAKFYDWLLFDLLEITIIWPEHSKMVEANVELIKSQPTNFELIDTLLHNIASVIAGQSVFEQTRESVLTFYYRQMAIKLDELVRIA